MNPLESDKPSGSTENQEEGKILFKKKKVPFLRGVKRQVEREDSDSDFSSSDDETVVIKKDRKINLNPLIQSTSSFNRKKQLRIDQNANDEKALSTVSVVYQSDKNADLAQPRDMGATATLEIDTEKERDAQSIFERARRLNEEEDLGDSNVYKGINNYKQYVQKKDSALGNASSGLVRQGPMRAPENLRSTIRWDYQPDVCKDYKETGFCGFGLSCKFLHDRSDYKHGWQIELEYQKGTYNKEDEEDFEIKEEEQLPFKCLKCRKTFKSPVVTKCKHYFCEVCALEHFRKSTSCFVCGQPTGGVFNIAKDIIKLLQTKKDNKDGDEDSDENAEGVNNVQELNDDEDSDDD